MQLIWVCGTRSGGGFLINLTRSVMNEDLRPLCLLSQGRRDLEDDTRSPPFREFQKEQNVSAYFERHSIRSVKIEDPGLDTVVLDICRAYPRVPVLTTYRKIEDVIISHFNIKTWGSSEDKVLNSWRNGIDMLEAVEKINPVYMVNLEQKDKFNLKRFVDFVGGDITPKATSLAAAWPKMNDLAYQKQRSGEEFVSKEYPPGIEKLRINHPWIDSIEDRYIKFWKRHS